jgi:outer membrane immunogenic protein
MRRLLVALIAVVLLAGLPRAAFAVEPTPIYNWTGFYVGLNAGWSWGKAETTTVLSAAPFTFQDSTHPDGAIGGVQVGYNWQGMSNWIFGVEADIQASGENASSSPLSQSAFFPIEEGFGVLVSDTISHTDAINWFGTVRGKIGVAVWPTMVFYTTGGLAYGDVSTSLSVTQTTALCIIFLGCGPSTTATSNVTGSTIKTGWTAGGGVMGAVPNSRVTWKVEYLYIDLGTANYSFNDPTVGLITISSKFTDNIVRVGFDYHY